LYPAIALHTFMAFKGTTLPLPSPSKYVYCFRTTQFVIRRSA